MRGRDLQLQSVMRCDAVGCLSAREKAQLPVLVSRHDETMSMSPPVPNLRQV